MARTRRKTLFSSMALSLPGSVGATLGVFPVAGYSRLTGFISVIGSATLSVKTGAASGVYAVTSTTAINSVAGYQFDHTLFGPVVEVALSQATSQSATAVVMGDTAPRGF